MTENKIKPSQSGRVSNLNFNLKGALKAAALGTLATKVGAADTFTNSGRALKQIVVAPPAGTGSSVAAVINPPPPPAPVATPPAPKATVPAPVATPAAAPRIAFPVTAQGARLQYASGDTARLIGMNVSPNDAGGVAPRNTSTTEQAWRAAVNQGANFLVADILEDLSMAQNGTKLVNVADLSNFALLNLPNTLVAWGPLTNDATDERGAPTEATNQILSTIAQDLAGNPNVAIMLGNQFARSKSDYANNVGNHEINTQLIAQVNKAYQAVRAVNPSVLVFIPSLIDETSGAQYSRSLQAWVGNTQNFTNAAFTSALWTTAANDTAQAQQVQDWVGQYQGKLPIVVTQMAPGQSTSAQTNMSQTVFANTVNALVANHTPVAFWNWEYQMNPSAQNAPITNASQLNLTAWGSQMANTVRNVTNGVTVLPQG